MSCNRRFTVLLTAVVLFALYACPSALAKKPTPPPPTAPVEYHLSMIEPLFAGTDMEIYDVNNHGVGVGYSRNVVDGKQLGIIWSATTGTVDMNTLSPHWYDLDTDSFVEGWVSRAGRSINDAGDISGTALNDDMFQRGFVYREGIFYLLPNPLADYNQARNINEDGLVHGGIRTNGFDWSVNYIWNPNDPKVLHFISIEDTPYDTTPNGLNSNYFSCYTVGFRAIYSFGFDPSGELFYTPVVMHTEASGTEVSAFVPPNINNYYLVKMPVGRYEVLSLRSLDTGVSIPIFQTRLNNDYKLRVDLNAINDVQDVAYNYDTKIKLYRYLDNESLDVFSLMDDASKAVYLNLVENSNNHYEQMVINDNVAGVPAADPFDSIVGKIGASDWFVLTPVELP